ncbi:DUF1433 domain-containing protein [Staphylococcus pasteuri]|uniref:DUF1433 domain-containing protein n=1 Tax=Staphylococcus TaxID=1279 RepID=UPI0008A3C086|nr:MULTISPECIES: DUF1433 domain-containing protein [Staphylococcus]OFV09274.1 hypothetical protein HMPREF3125_07365 [Staphylococcus sp. HMSC13A10]UXR67561.1 DUF1433 domain-containing protein [Staphylococcus pasteuri]
MKRFVLILRIFAVLVLVEIIIFIGALCTHLYFQHQYIQKEGKRIELFLKYNFKNINSTTVYKSNSDSPLGSYNIIVRINGDKNKELSYDAECGNYNPKFNGEDYILNGNLKKQKANRKIKSVKEILKERNANSVNDALRKIQSEGEQHEENN